MPKKKDLKGSRQATLAGVQKEMAKPRVAKSARKEYANLGRWRGLFCCSLATAGKPNLKRSAPKFPKSCWRR
ncbi:MAG: hypothetical protein DMG49_08455 [Acidobacteria bacterium]|nr:MAG: hypothetical protein DMG49_08455 [Acidobacteriota bacterium]